MTKRSSPLTEEKLIEALKSKNRIGAEALYDMYSKSLFGVLLKMVNDQELAENLLQQSFLKIWRSIDCYDAAKGRLFTWMIAITKNLGRDSLRSRMYHQRLVTDPLEFHSDHIEKQDPVVLNMDTIGIKAWVDNLKKDHKDVLNLIYYKGYTHKEVAEELDIPLGTVKTRCRTAICILRGRFDDPVARGSQFS